MMMKKLFILSLASLGFWACSKRADYALLSGKFDGLNGAPLELRLIGGDVDKTIKVQPDGTFKDTIKAPDNYYVLFNPQGIELPMYLAQGDELAVNIDVTKMPLSIKLAGKDTVATAYLRKKFDLSIELQNGLEDLFKKGVEDFKKGVEDYGKKYTDFLKNTKNLSSDFVKKEEKAINYEMLYAKSVYERAHKRYSGEEVKLPKEFADEVAKLDYDNAEDYNTFHTYKELVLNNLFDKYDDNAANPWGKLIDHVKGLKSASIKKDLARYFITGVSAGNADEINQQMVSFIKEYVKDTAAIKELDKRLKSIEKTKTGSNFAGFEAEDINGKAVNYESLKGKLVYVDVWATWCKPCLQELPAMKALQEEYKGKDITFVSLSVDKDKEAWKAMVTEEKMQGVQLHIDLGAHRDFIENYDLTGIPRFFLISKEGKIISISAPRPSEAKIKELINANL